jgi:hypothetical protein
MTHRLSSRSFSRQSPGDIKNRNSKKAEKEDFL